MKTTNSYKKRWCFHNNAHAFLLQSSSNKKKPILSSRTQCKWKKMKFVKKSKKKGDDTIRRWCCNKVALILIKFNKSCKEDKVHTSLLQNSSNKNPYNSYKKFFKLPMFIVIHEWLQHTLNYTLFCQSFRKTINTIVEIFKKFNYKNLESNPNLTQVSTYRFSRLYGQTMFKYGQLWPIITQLNKKSNHFTVSCIF